MIRRILGGAPPEERDISFQDIFKRGLDLVDVSTTSGENINYDSAMTLSAVFGAIRLLSDSISTLPYDVKFRRQRVEEAFRPLPAFLTNMNRNLTNQDVLNQIMTSMLLDGNAYIATLRNNSGEVIELTPLDPTTVTPELSSMEDGNKVLTFKSSNASGELFTTRDIAHFRGLQKAGSITGVSPITMARELLGLGVAAQKYGAAFFGNSGLPNGIVEVAGTLSPEGAQQLKAAWNDVHRGASNSHKLAVLTEGAKFSKIPNISNEDSQFLMTKQSTVGDVARIYGIPPHLLADMTSSTTWGSGLFEQNQAFSQYSLRPYIVRLETGLTNIMRSQGISVAYVKFDLASMHRGTAESIDRLSKGLMNGIYSIDEVREQLALPPLPNGEGTQHFVPLNLAPIDQIGQDQ